MCIPNLNTKFLISFVNICCNDIQPLCIFLCFSNADKNISIHGKDRMVDLFTACTKDALVVSEVFCLHKDYRKDVPPPSKNLFVVHFCF